MNGEIQIKILPDGRVEMEVAGMQGTSCEEVTRAIIENLGEVEEQNFTEEYCMELPQTLDAWNAGEDE